jgi:hypothetical protein
MNKAQQLFSKPINGCNQSEEYSNPTAPIQKSKKCSERVYSAVFDLDPNLVNAQMEFALLCNVSMFHLELACYFIFLYELNNDSINDLCVACPTDNHPSVDRNSISGNFVNILLYRIEIEPNHSFINLLKRICQLCTDILQHTQLTYQLNTTDTNDLYSPTIPFHFRYSSTNSLLIEQTILKPKTENGTFSLYTDSVWSHDNDVASNDLTLTMIHNHHERKTRCIFECSMDCYDETTPSKMSRCYQNLLQHLFTKNTTTNEFDQTLQSIANLSLQMQDIDQCSRKDLQKRLDFSEKSEFFMTFYEIDSIIFLMHF